MNNTFKFDYNNSILSVSNSLLKYYGLPTYHPSLKFLDEKLNKNPQNVILMILDGMGVDLIEKNLPKTSFIRQHLSSSIFSVFPPTTAAATTAFHSGLSPWESGWIGWMSYYKQYDEIIENFRNTAFYSGKKLNTPAPMEEILKYETIYEKIVRKNPSLEYHKIFPPFEKGGVNSFEEMCSKIISLTKKNTNPKLFCAYWTEPDHSVHKFGTTASEIKNILTDIDINLQKLNTELNDSLVIVSADHGEIDVDEIYLNDYPYLCEMFIRPPALEARFITFFIKEDKHSEFHTEFNKIFSSQFKLFSKQDFIKSGLLGSGVPHTQLFDFLGDFIAISTSEKSLRYTTGEKVFASLKADHAGISEQEMRVPLIILEKY